MFVLLGPSSISAIAELVLLNPSVNFDLCTSNMNPLKPVSELVCNNVYSRCPLNHLCIQTIFDIIFPNWISVLYALTWTDRRYLNNNNLGSVFRITTEKAYDILFAFWYILACLSIYDCQTRKNMRALVEAELVLLSERDLE